MNVVKLLKIRKEKQKMSKIIFLLIKNIENGLNKIIICNLKRKIKKFMTKSD